MSQFISCQFLRRALRYLVATSFVLTAACPEDTRRGGAEVACSDAPVLTDLGWSNLGSQRKLGDLYSGVLSNRGGETCIQMQRVGTLRLAADDVLVSARVGSTYASIQRGIDIKFDADVPEVVKISAESKIARSSSILLEGVNTATIASPFEEIAMMSDVASVSCCVKFSCRAGSDL